MLAAQRRDVYTPRIRGSNACDYKGAGTKVDPGPFVVALAKAVGPTRRHRAANRMERKSGARASQQDCAPSLFRKAALTGKPANTPTPSERVIRSEAVGQAYALLCDAARYRAQNGRTCSES
ncbi:hypothetical protein MTO96_016702 [Rhipicephalus appendiculatus]